MAWYRVFYCNPSLKTRFGTESRTAKTMAGSKLPPSELGLACACKCVTTVRDIEVVAECRNGSEVVKSLKAAKTELLFLDIQMPGRDGFEVIEEIGPVNMPITVFVTAHNEHAVNAFEVHALDYLVKPIERRRFDQTLARVKERVQLEEAFTAREQISCAVEALRQVSHPERPQRFLTRSGNTASVVSVSDIEWIEAADYYVCLHAGGKRHLLRESIRAL